jgi:hypothetical protein
MKYLILIPFLFLACSKQTQQPVRVGGAMPDMPNTVQIVTSPSFFVKKKIADVVVSKVTTDRGKPVKQPSVSFLSPLNGAVVSGVVYVSVSIRNATAVSISINGTVVSNTTSYSWNTNGLFSGNYLLSATASDALGNSRTTSITVSINTIVVDPPAPVSGVQITMPPVMNQGGEGSCAAFAIGYAARSVEYFNTTGILKTFSPEHLYNNVKFGTDCYSGTAMQTCLEFIMANGILPWSEMPYTSGTCADVTTEAQKQIALDYKIAGFFKMYVTDTAAIKGMVRLNKPVIISILTSYAFNWAVYDFTWNEPGSAFVTPHCVVICGYDDTRKAYRIFNSWGTNWGGSGYAWMDYDFFLTRTGTYCYAIK